MIAAEIDNYMQEQVNIGNYIEVDIHVARQEGHQLHFVGYNFMVSSTSSSTTDLQENRPSPMHCTGRTRQTLPG